MTLKKLVSVFNASASQLLLETVFISTAYTDREKVANMNEDVFAYTIISNLND